jgi:uncharacterized membrane protein
MLESPQTGRQRLPMIDALRGVALLAMVVYHFSWDLDYHGLVGWDVAGDPAWLAFAMGIAATFLTLSGVSLVLASRGGIDPAAFGRRLLKIAAAAALVSVATRLMFPEAWIFFGILHMIALGSVLGLAFLRLPAVLTLVAAGAALVLPMFVRGAVFDSPWLVFLGLSTEAPPSNDFVPVFPWFAPILVGIAIGRLIVAGTLPVPALRPDSRASRLLVLIGRWTLPIYLVHQAVLFTLVGAVAAMIPADPVVERDRFVRACVASCGPASEGCTTYCQCVAEAMDGTSFWTVRGGDPDLTPLVSTAAMACRPGEVPME